MWTDRREGGNSGLDYQIKNKVNPSIFSKILNHIKKSFFIKKLALNFEPKVNKKMSQPDQLMFPKGRFLDYKTHYGLNENNMKAPKYHFPLLLTGEAWVFSERRRVSSYDRIISSNSMVDAIPHVLMIMWSRAAKKLDKVFKMIMFILGSQRSSHRHKDITFIEPGFKRVPPSL